jgi:hypothetical protein
MVFPWGCCAPSAGRRKTAWRETRGRSTSSLLRRRTPTPGSRVCATRAPWPAKCLYPGALGHGPRRRPLRALRRMAPGPERRSPGPGQAQPTDYRAHSLFAAVRAEEVRGRLAIHVGRQSARPKKSKQKARPKRKERTAEVALRYRKIELRPPPPAPPDVRITHPAVLLSDEAPDSSKCG